MKKVDIKDIYNYGAKARENLFKLAKGVGRNPKIYLHWSAGKYSSFFSDYHINIDYDGSIYVSTTNFAETKSHTWKRNTGSIGITLACAYNGNTNSLGNYPPTAKQIESMAKVIAYLCKALWLPINKDTVLTHGEAADNEDGIYPHENYGPKSTCERWDLEYLGTKESPRFNPYATDRSRGGDILRGKAIWYYNQIKF